MGKKAILIILDGWGIAEKSSVNAFTEGNTPNLDKLLEVYPHSKLSCSGEAVGLPRGQQGNSEVGHLNLGAGRVVYQELLRIERAIEDKSFHQNKAFLDLMNGLKAKNKALHLMGLVSDGGVHSHQKHLYELLKLAKSVGLTKVYIHAFLDGRDVPPSSAQGFLDALEKEIEAIGVGEIATLSGRYYAMDRDNRWERVELAYRAINAAEGKRYEDAMKGIQASYQENLTDEFILPSVVSSNYQGLEADDGVIFFNFRADRARELTKALALEAFSGFDRKDFKAIKIVTMTAYEQGLESYLTVAYPPYQLSNTLGEYLAKHDKNQVRIAETEKYAHVTFFFNGGVEKENANEERILIPSPKVATYDLKPEMSANEVCEQVVASLGKYDFILVNFANPDMVGHTGKLEPAKEAMQVVDKAVGKIYEAIDFSEYTMFICADHGNCEKMADENGIPFTSHTSNPVHLIVVSDNVVSVEDGALSDVAPSVLSVMNLDKPEEMTGKSLISF